MVRNTAALSCASLSPMTKSRDVAVEKPAVIDSKDISFCRLSGTSGNSAVVGELLKVENGAACWKLHPNYAAWFWPLMSRVNDLVLLLPEKLLEPMQKGDSTAPPTAPNEEEKREILQL